MSKRTFLDGAFLIFKVAAKKSITGLNIPTYILMVDLATPWFDIVLRNSHFLG
jgi:uncharacterized membrane protein YcaP (DUF421 family)